MMRNLVFFNTEFPKLVETAALSIPMRFIFIAHAVYNCLKHLFQLVPVKLSWAG